MAHDDRSDPPFVFPALRQEPLAGAAHVRIAIARAPCG